MFIIQLILDIVLSPQMFVVSPLFPPFVDSKNKKSFKLL